MGLIAATTQSHSTHQSLTPRAAIIQPTPILLSSFPGPPTPYQYGFFVADKNGNVIASNTAGADPETISIPVSTTPNLATNGPYTIVTTLEIGTPGMGYNATISLTQLTSSINQGTTAPRYQMYVGPDNQSGEPSIGVDWNPNVATYEQTAAGNSAHGPTLLDTGGVAFFTANLNQYRVTFDDCSSPAINTWTAVTFPTESITTLDPIGFTDHFANVPLGTSYPPPKTPGRTGKPNCQALAASQLTQIMMAEVTRRQREQATDRTGPRNRSRRSLQSEFYTATASKRGLCKRFLLLHPEHRRRRGMLAK